MTDKDMPSRRQFVPLQIAVMTISDSRSESTDKSGSLLSTRIEQAGHVLCDRRIVPDDVYEIRAVASNWIRDPDIRAILTTGGTGLTGRDGTPEAMQPLFDKEIEGFGEMFRVLSWESIGASTMQSRAVAGVANGKYIFCLPGSPGACTDGWDKLIAPQLDARTRPCNLVELMPRLDES